MVHCEHKSFSETAQPVQWTHYCFESSKAQLRRRNLSWTLVPRDYKVYQSVSAAQSADHLGVGRHCQIEKRRFLRWISASLRRVNEDGWHHKIADKLPEWSYSSELRRLPWPHKSDPGQHWPCRVRNAASTARCSFRRKYRLLCRDVNQPGPGPNRE